MKRVWGSMRIIILILAFTLLLTDINVAQIEPVAVIVNKDNPVTLLSDSDIRRIYTNSILKWPDGKPITLYDLAIDNPLRNVFSEKVSIEMGAIGYVSFSAAKGNTAVKIVSIIQ